MKKFLSLILITIMVFTALSLNTVVVFAETTASVQYPNLGQSVYSTNGENYTPVLPIDLDGYIDESEGWVCVTPDFVNKTALSDEYRFDSWFSNASIEILEDQSAQQYTSNFKYYVAQDEDNVYIGVADYAPYFEVDGTDGFSKASESLARNMYGLRIGFDPEDYTRALYFREVNGVDQLLMLTETSYVSVSKEGLFEYSFLRYNNDITAVIGQSNNLSVNAHYWTTPCYQWVAHIEMKISKELIKEVYCEVYGEGSDANIDFETMFISASAKACRANPEASSSYFWAYAVYGTIVSPEVAQTNSLPERYIPDIIAFGENCDAEGAIIHKGGTATCTAKAECTACGEEYGELDADNHSDEATWTKTATNHSKTYACCNGVAVAEENHEWVDGVCSECEYACEHTGAAETCDVCGKVLETETTDSVEDTTEPVEDITEEVTTKTPETTKAPETTAAVEEKSGCGSSVSVAGLVLVAALGTCTAFAAKKREE